MPREDIESARPASDGLVIVDKPAGLTSHDVVARIRRLSGMRRVGHAGTLDPMATGVLVVGLGRATRLLGYLSAHEKTYSATIRLGQSTVTDDAEGDVVASTDASAIDDASVNYAVSLFIGEIQQAPTAVSAIKVEGKRSYRRVRDGEEVKLAPRAVTVSRFDVLTIRRERPAVVDVDVVVHCTSGTYVRALARDVGAELGVGGHLTALQRTASGPFAINQARSLDSLADELAPISLSEAVRANFPTLTLTTEHATDVRHGRALDAALVENRADGAAGSSDVVGAFGESGEVLALMAIKDDALRVVVGFTG